MANLAIEFGAVSQPSTKTSPSSDGNELPEELTVEVVRDLNRQDWHAISWEKVNQNVRRLQARIVKATQQGRWGKVKALQRLLTRSFSAKALAIKRVCENTGHNTPGIDGVRLDTPAKKIATLLSLQPRGYKPKPQKRVFIPKSNGKLRPLGILTMQDRAMQTLYLLALDPVAETLADPHSYGFRRNRSPADAIERCFKVFNGKDAAPYILEGDIRACFDEISHQWLLQHIPIEKQILQKWLKAGYIYKKQLFATDKGTVQGGPLSPVLANLTLDGLEKTLAAHFNPKATSKGRLLYKVHLIRFADDVRHLTHN